MFLSERGATARRAGGPRAPQRLPRQSYCTEADSSSRTPRRPEQPAARIRSSSPRAGSPAIEEGPQLRFVEGLLFQEQSRAALEDVAVPLEDARRRRERLRDQAPHGIVDGLGRGHIKDFLATAGVGMASQYVEQIGVKLLGKVFGRGLLGRLLGGVAKQAVSSGFSFATTYALGRLAIRYYAGGRTFSAQVLKDTYASLLGEAKGLQGQYLPAIQEKARTVNVAQILQDVRQ
jgi:hypothetical protein